MTASFLAHPPTWDRADWLEWRRDGIGGSDVAALAGLSTFGSPTSVYYDKVGLAPEQPESELMRWGRVLEPVIASEFTVATGLHVVVPQALVWDVEHPWRRCTLDGLVVESNAEWPDMGFLELVLGTNQMKTTGAGSWRDRIPPDIEAQCQWEMGIAELERCWLTVLHMSGFDRHFAVYEIEFDLPAFAALCRISDRFWEKHVLAGNPPRPDSNPATTDALKAAYGHRAEGSTIELDDELVTVAEEWLRAKAAEDAAKTRREGAENALRSALGEHTYGAYGETELVSWKPQRKAGRIDEKALRADHPEIWAKYRAPDGITRVLRATKALKARVDVDIVDLAEEEASK